MEYKIRTRLWITAGIAVFWGLALGCFASFAMPMFEAMFENFGAEVPYLTLFALKYGQALWAFFILVLMMNFWVVKVKPFSQEIERRFLWAFILLIFIELFAISISIYAMYLPMFSI